MNQKGLDKLGEFLENYLDCEIQISNPIKLSGGAIQQNWGLDVFVSSGEWAGNQKMVLRLDADTSVTASHSRSEEFAILKVAYENGVSVPKPLLFSEDKSLFGSAFFLMSRVSGVSEAYRLVKQTENTKLVEELGQNLARIHAIPLTSPELSFLPSPPENPAGESIRLYRSFLDNLSQPHPAIEWGLSWLERNLPRVKEIVLCHRDYRTGNIIVEEGKLKAILDWEFAGWSDPMEDIFWFTAKCWRFGKYDRSAGGLGKREDFYHAYETTSGRQVDLSFQIFWEVMAHVRWAVIACQQAERYTIGNEKSIELALTAHVVPELELEILSLTMEG